MGTLLPMDSRPFLGSEQTRQMICVQDVRSLRIDGHVKFSIKNVHRKNHSCYGNGFSESLLSLALLHFLHECLNE
jgi:hypothetical protein